MSMWDVIYKTFKEDLIYIMREETDAIVTTKYQDGTRSQELIIVYVARSGLHKLGSKPRILPYTDMIWWEIGHINPLMQKIITPNGVVIGSF